MAVGPTYLADGNTPSTGRQTKTGDAGISQCHGKYYEPSSRGVLFCAADAGVGVAVTVTLTTTATATLHNPLGSAKRLSLKKVAIAYFSGTMPAGALYHGYLVPGNTLPSSGTAPTVVCMDIGNQSGVLPVGVMRTAATVVAANILYPFASSLPVLASTAVWATPCLEDVDGAITLEPGAQYQLVCVAGGAGSSPKVGVGFVWEEIPIVAANG